MKPPAGSKRKFEREHQDQQRRQPEIGNGAENGRERS